MLHGRYQGESTLADSRQTRLAIRGFKVADPAAQLLGIARDSDGDGERRKGFREAWEVRGSPPDVVLALINLESAETETDDQTGRAEYLRDVRTGLRALRNAWQRP